MNETMGNRIARLRKAKGLTQEGLAEKLGVSSQAVSKWENDGSCPDVSLLPRLSQILGISTDELLSGKQEKVRLLTGQDRKPLEEMTLRVRILSAGGDKIRVNLPMPLVKAALEMGLDISAGMNGSEAVKKLDLTKILDLVEQGVIGKLVEMESAEGDTVEVVVE